MNKQYRLEIEPNILELLGPSLYTNIYYVLAELIANAYDAQAQNVYVIAEEDCIIVEDDGLGMTYEEVSKHYLAVARESRRTEADTYTQNGRRRMGRKGIGKLAALSVSENVWVQTRSGKDVSGFILSRYVNSNKLLTPLTEEQISFRKITGNGTSIIMTHPEYHLHKNLQVVKKNIAKIFPAVNSCFKIHIIRKKEAVTLESFDTQILSELCSIITLGDSFKDYGSNVLVEDNSHRNELISLRQSWCENIFLKNRAGETHPYKLEINGWIGAYKTTRNRKTVFTDFPDNHISLYANDKLGQFDILPLVGQNRLNEVYVVGQLYVDLFEETELPDMALSNRQGYKSDDPRYICVIDYIRTTLLPEILTLREKWSDYKNEDRKRQKLREQEEKECQLRASQKRYQNSVRLTVAKVAEELLRRGKPLTKKNVVSIVEAALNKHNPDIGLKATVDGLKKKLLISHTSADKDFAEIAYKMLQYNGIDKNDIIYTSSEDEEARIPRGVGIFDYLRRFFVESVSTEMVYVVFITSEKMSTSWAVLSEIGAAWITRKNHQIFNIAPFTPKEPLNIRAEWQVCWRDEDNEGALYTIVRNADVYCQFIEGIVHDLGGSHKTRKQNMAYLCTLLDVRNKLPFANQMGQGFRKE